MPGRTRGWWLKSPRGSHVQGMLGKLKSPRRTATAEEVLSKPYTPPNLDSLPMLDGILVTTSIRVVFIGGPLDGRATYLKDTPPMVQFGTHFFYRRIDDPGTDEFLGGYALDEDATWPELKDL